MSCFSFLCFISSVSVSLDSTFIVLVFCVVTSVLFVFVLCLVSNVVCVSGFYLHCFSFLCYNFCFICLRSKTKLVSNVVCVSEFYLHCFSFCVVTSVLFVFVLCLVSNVVCVSGFYLHCFSFLCYNFCFICLRSVSCV